MSQSAYNGDTKSIFPGAAIAGKTSRMRFDRVVLAGGTVLAGAITTDGARTKGVVSLAISGEMVELNNWSLATGAKLLSQGKQYTLGANGKLVCDGDGQLLGIAVSKTQLMVSIGNDSQGGVNAEIAEVAADLAEHEADTSVHVLSHTYSGTYALANAVDSGTITGLGLSWVPKTITLTLEKPEGGLNLFATVVTGFTQDGFDFVLNGTTDDTTYKLHYQLAE